MANINGKMYSCDRCGDKIFVKVIGVREMDGGFTHYNTFEDMPEGWGYDHRVEMDLCPKCKQALDSLIELYKDGNKNPLRTLLLDLINSASCKKEIIGCGPDEKPECVNVYSLPDYKINEIAKKYGVFIWETLNK